MILPPPAAAGGLMLIDDGAGRRVALALSGPARVEPVEAVYPGDGGPLRVAAVGGRIIAARSLSAALNRKPESAEPQALVFGDVCLTVPRILGIVPDARIETVESADGCEQWWRAPDGTIVEVIDPARLLPTDDESPPVPTAPPSGLAALYGAHVLTFPATAVRRVRSARATPLLPPRPPPAGVAALRVVDGARLIGADSAPPAVYIEFVAGGWVLAAPRVRLIFSDAVTRPPPPNRRLLVAATFGRLRCDDAPADNDIFTTADENLP